MAASERASKRATGQSKRNVRTTVADNLFNTRFNGGAIIPSLKIEGGREKREKEKKKEREKRRGKKEKEQEGNHNNNNNESCKCFFFARYEK